MVYCQRCRIRPAIVQKQMFIDGQLVYMNLCDKCAYEVQSQAAGTSYLDKYGRDLTDLARKGKLDPVVGRKNEIERVIHILSRRTKNNPVLIGDPGVGKTAIVESLAQRLAQGLVPETLAGKRLVALDLALMIAGAKHRGEFEDRLKKTIDEVTKAQGQIILFIDELHTVVGAGAAEGAIDAANMLKPALARGELQTIGATTLDEYREYIERDGALERRFQPILVQEPTIEETLEILRGLRERYEQHHHVKIEENALRAAAELSDRYISDRFLPDKAVDLMDEAASAARLGAVKEPENLKKVEEELKQIRKSIEKAKDDNEKLKLEAKIAELETVKQELTDLWQRTKLEETPKVTKRDIARVVARITGVPLEDISEEEKQKLIHLEERIHQRIVNQSEAVQKVAEAIRRSRAGLKSPNRPIGSFIFLGPTGVGKTELTKALSEVLYGSEDLMVRLDMSEYQEKHTVSRMIGAPPGYIGYEEGGQLTEIVRRKPFSVILMDEIEKAHPEVFNLLLQIMEDGRLTDGHGRTVDFKNTILIMTSNLGSDIIHKHTLGFDLNDKSIKQEKIDTDSEALKERLQEILRETFRPEFLNRLDEIIIFKSLGHKEIEQIVEKELERTENLLASQKMRLEVTSRAKKYLAKKGFDPEFGARPLRRLIQAEIENYISNKIIGEECGEGNTVSVDTTGKRLKFTIK